jgi:hypothetical protein
MYPSEHSKRDPLNPEWLNLYHQNSLNEPKCKGLKKPRLPVIGSLFGRTE